jgi:hypothetical protein
MKQSALLATLSLTIALAACGEAPDGGDTADLAPDAVTAGTGDTTDETYQPGEDGPLQNDVVPADETMEPMDEPPVMDEDMAPPPAE